MPDNSGVFAFIDTNGLSTSTTLTLNDPKGSNPLLIIVREQDRDKDYFLRLNGDFFSTFNMKMNTSVVSWKFLDASTTDKTSTSTRTSSSATSMSAAPSTTSNLPAATFSSVLLTATVTSTATSTLQAGSSISRGSLAGTVIGIAIAVSAMTILLTIIAVRYRARRKEKFPSAATVTFEPSTSSAEIEGSKPQQSGDMIEAAPPRA